MQKDKERREHVPERGGSFYGNGSGAASLATTVLLVRVVSAVVQAVALPEARLAAAVAALHLRGLALCKHTQPRRPSKAAPPGGRGLNLYPWGTHCSCPRRCHRRSRSNRRTAASC